jgi:DNA-binding transcriptional MerR regulator
MKKCIEELNPIMNQTRLAELLKLPSNVIRFLREENIIKSERVEMNYVFDEKSVEQFRESFDVEDYLTVSECKRKLQKYKFYSEYLYSKFFHNDLRIYITVKKLIKGGYDIPDEYRLSVKKFGTTQYISRGSFAKTLNWLRNVDHNINRRLTKQQSEEFSKRYEEITQKRKEYIKKFYTGSIQFSPQQLRKRYGLRFQLPV